MEKAEWHSIRSKVSTTFVTHSVPAKTICSSDSEFTWKADVSKQRLSETRDTRGVLLSYHRSFIFLEFRYPTQLGQYPLETIFSRQSISSLSTNISIHQQS